MALNLEKWVERLQKEGLMEWALNYLIRRGRVHRTSTMHSVGSPRQIKDRLLDEVMEMDRSDEGRLALKALKDAIRQERSIRQRELRDESVKRLLLNNTACKKLAQLSRATKWTQSKVVENLIIEEATLRKHESVSNRALREQLSERSKRLTYEENELKDREDDLLRREMDFSEKLGRLMVCEDIVESVIRHYENGNFIKSELDLGEWAGDINNFCSKTVDVSQLELLLDFLKSNLERPKFNEGDSEKK